MHQVQFQSRWLPFNFYLKVAKLQSLKQNKKILENLASMEDHHRLIFEKMKTHLTEKEKTTTVFDPMGESVQYLAAMADSHGGEGSQTVVDTLTGEESMSDIIDMAIRLEKESILFYLGRKDLVPPKFGRDKVDQIIREERKQVIQLNAHRKNLLKKRCWIGVEV